MPLENPLQFPAPPVKTPREREAELIKWWDRFFLILLGFAFFFVKNRKKNSRNIGLTEKIIVDTMTVMWVYLGYAIVFELRKDFVHWESIYWGLFLLIYHWSASLIAVELWRLVYIGGLYMIPRFSNRETAAEKLERQLHERAISIRESQVVQASSVPDTQENVLSLGIWLDTIEEEPYQVEYDGTRWKYLHKTRNNFVGLHENALSEHILVIGKSGSGKTVLLKQLLASILQYTDYNVYLIDGKGRPQKEDRDKPTFADEFAAMMSAHGRGPIPVFRYGYEPNNSLYNPFHGSRAAICNRLKELLHLRELTGDSRWYAEQQALILEYACGITNPRFDIKPPNSFSDLLDRIDIQALCDLYKIKTGKGAKNPPGKDRIARGIGKIHPQRFGDLYTRVSRWDNAFGPLTGPEGFILEESRGACFSIRALGHEDSAKDISRLIFADFKDFVGNRMKHPSIFIIDEFALIGSDNIISLHQQAREYGAGVILATQTHTSLGDINAQNEILINSGTLFLMQYLKAEDITELLGTKTEQDISYRVQDGTVTGQSTIKDVEKYKVQPSQVTKLARGEVFVMRGGYGYKIHTTNPKIPDPSPHDIKWIGTEPAVPQPPVANTLKIQKGMEDVQ